MTEQKMAKIKNPISGRMITVGSLTHNRLMEHGVLEDTRIPKKTPMPSGIAVVLPQSVPVEEEKRDEEEEKEIESVSESEEKEIESEKESEEQDLFEEKKYDSGSDEDEFFHTPDYIKYKKTLSRAEMSKMRKENEGKSLHEVMLLMELLTDTIASKSG